MERLMRYFTVHVRECDLGTSIGMEVETHFVDKMYRPITIQQSQRFFRELVEQNAWTVRQKKGELIVEIRDQQGNKVLYELGRQNIELATVPQKAFGIVAYTRRVLKELYRIGKGVGVYPCFWPILDTDEELLVIPDKRDAIWLELDGRPALELLARIAAVQFTIAVSPRDAVRSLNRLGKNIGHFLVDYPQEAHWRHYVKESHANYHPLRYGGPLFFKDLPDYCARLAEHAIVQGPRLISYNQVQELDIALFLRSIWWYFRLKRYGPALCIEVRPLARRTDQVL